jgi:hypothetical protein
MAVLDVPLARTRVSARPIAALLAGGALAWIAFLTFELGRAAYNLGRTDHELRGLHPSAELQVMLAAPLVALALGAVVALARPRALPALTALAAVAAIAAMALLTITSGQSKEALVFAALMGWCWFVGSPLLALLEGEERLLLGWGRVALETTLGIAVLSFSILAIALAAALSDAGMVCVFVLEPMMAALLRLRSPRGRQFWSAAPAVRSSEHEFVEYVALVVLAVSFVVSFGASLAPQVQFDALHYHFAMPRIFLSEGRLIERPDIIQGYFPLGLEMTYVPAYRFGGEATMTLLHWAMAPTLVALVWGGGNRFFGRPAGAISAALIGLAALVTFESSSASSDLAVTVWTVAAGLAVAAYASHPSWRAALMAGLFGGLALTFKIVAGIYVLPLALAFIAGLIIWSRRGPLEAGRDAAAFAAGGLLTGAPWLLIRFFQTGNPVFPLYNNVFKSDRWPPVHERFDLWLYGVGHNIDDAGTVWWQIAVHPWRFGQWLPPWAIGLPALTFVAALLMAPWLPKSRPAVFLALVALLTAGSWFLLSQYHRYGLPAFSLLAMVGGAGIWAAARQLPKPLPAVALTAALSVWFAGGVILTLVMGVPEPYPTRVVLGQESREAFRDRSVADYYPLSYLESVTRGTDDQAAILGYPYNYFVTNRLYDVIVPETLSPFRRIALSGASPGVMARELLDSHIRWLVVDYNPIGGESQWPPDWLARGVLSDAFLQAHTEVAFEKYRVVVYRILDR